MDNVSSEVFFFWCRFHRRRGILCDCLVGVAQCESPFAFSRRTAPTFAVCTSFVDATTAF